MNSVMEILWIILIYIFLQRFVLIGMSVVKKAVSVTRKTQPQVDDLKGMEMEKEESEEPIEMIATFCCGIEIPRNKAYQVATGQGNVHFFCSWQCRRDFVEKQSNEIKQEEGI